MLKLLKLKDYTGDVVYINTHRVEAVYLEKVMTETGLEDYAHVAISNGMSISVEGTVDSIAEMIERVDEADIARTAEGPLEEALEKKYKITIVSVKEDADGVFKEGEVYDNLNLVHKNIVAEILGQWCKIQIDEMV